MQFHEEFLGTYSKSNYTAQNRNLKGVPAQVSSLRGKLEKFAKGAPAPRFKPFGFHLPPLAGRIPQRPLSLNFCLMFFFALASVAPLTAETYTLGGKKGWADVTVRNGITTGKGRYGYESLELDTNQQKTTGTTDLLIDFENGDISDRAAKYTVIESNVQPSKKAVRGKGSALSMNKFSAAKGRKQGGIILRGDSTSFFGNESPAGSFKIDWWLCPSTVENGETLMNWRSSRNRGNDIVYQLLNVSFYQNKIMAVFTNIFDGYHKDSGEVVLTTQRSIIPNKWSHHTIRYEENSGLLEYRINGELECVRFITDTGHENGTVFPAIMGIGADFELCPNYSGLIDDFCIERSYEEAHCAGSDQLVETIAPVRYVISGGRFESKPLVLQEGSIITSVHAETSVPPQTDIHLYIRGSDNYLNWTKDSPEWIQITSDSKIENLSGMYFQVAAELFPDGAGEHTPSVTSLRLDYAVQPVPVPPPRITAQKGDGSVTLTWARSVEDSTGGYYIYYGNRPGEYLGRIATEGASPINAGNVTAYTLTGLQNGTIYYFAVSAYSKYDAHISGALSKEVYARPSAR